MAETNPLPPNVEAALHELLRLPSDLRAEVGYRLLDSLYLSDLPDNRELRGEAERQDLRERLTVQVRRVLQCSAAWNNPPPDPSRIDETRGSPRIRGTRITVHAIIDYLKHGWDCAQMTFMFRGVLPEDVLAAVDYIGRHLDEVVAEYQSILERHRNYRYPPEVQKKLDEAHERFVKHVDEIRGQRSAELVHAADHAGS